MTPVRPTAAVLAQVAAEPRAVMRLPEAEIVATVDWVMFRTVSDYAPLATTVVGVSDMERCVLALLAELADARGVVVGNPLSRMAERLGWLTPPVRFAWIDGDLVDLVTGDYARTEEPDLEAANDWLAEPFDRLVRRGYVRRLADGVMLVRRVA